MVEKAAKMAVAAVSVALTVILLCGCDDTVIPTDKAVRAHGMPLDACEVIEYDRPIWLTDCEHAYKVYDRQTGDAWWLLKLYDGGEGNPGYVVLPLDEADR